MTHDEEPDTKIVILDDYGVDDMDNDGLDIRALQARHEDEMFLSKSILGHDLHEVYSNQRINIAINRNMLVCVCA